MPLRGRGGRPVNNRTTALAVVPVARARRDDRHPIGSFCRAITSFSIGALGRWLPPVNALSLASTQRLVAGICSRGQANGLSVQRGSARVGAAAGAGAAGAPRAGGAPAEPPAL